jgi:hypothetical protein
VFSAMSCCAATVLLDDPHQFNAGSAVPVCTSVSSPIWSCLLKCQVQKSLCGVSELQSTCQAAGLRECALGGGGGQPRIPAWLEKWTALILRFVEDEQRLLPDQLLALPSHLASYTPFTATAEAKGMRSLHQ